jgi:putative ABC transport system permease protein
MNKKVEPDFLKPRWSKIAADLWEDKTRTGLVVASIAVGVFAIGMIITAFTVLNKDVNESYASVNPANIEVWTDPFQENLVRVIEEVPDVEDVEGRTIIGVRARKGSEDWKSISLIGMEHFENIVINKLDTIDGIQIPGRDEIVVSQDINNNTGFQVGDKIEVELPDESMHTLTVVGLVTDQTAANMEVPSGANAFITLETMRSFGFGQYNNRLLITVQGDGSDEELISQVAGIVKTKVERNNRNVYRIAERVSTQHPMIKTLTAIMGILGALGGLITILSGSLIINMLTALMTQQLRQIGVMKLVGGLSSQILGMYLTLIVCYSLISLIFAIPLGAMAGNALAGFIAHLLGAVVQGFRFVPTAVVAQVLLAFLVPLVSGYFPIRQGARINVRQALSDYRAGDQPARRSLVNLSRLTGWISRPILLSFRNTFRKIGRLMLTIFTLTIAGAVFIAVFNVRSTMNHVMDQVMQHFLGDVTLTFSRPYRTDQIERVLKVNVPGVIGVEGWGGAKGEIKDENDNLVANLSISAPPQDTQLLHTEFVAGRWLLPNEQKAIVVSDSIYKYYPTLKPGDKLLIKLPSQPKEAWMVVGIFRFVNMLGDPIAYANFDFLAAKTGLPNQAVSFRVITEDHDTASQQNLAQRIDSYLSAREYAVESVKTGDSLRESSAMAVNTLIIFLLIMAILTAFVGSIGLTGTMSINVLERTREIGVMRTIGAVDFVIMQSVITEALVIGLITWVLAIGLSFPISSILMTIIGQTMMGSATNIIFTPLGVVLWLVIIVVLSVFASILPARNAARLTINEVLAYE